MRSFQIHPIFDAIVGAFLLLSAIFAFIGLPVVCLNWVWNSWVITMTALPAIGLWQAALLYIAFVCILYLSDIVHIEFKTERLD